MSITNYIMNHIPKSIQNTIEQFSRLPGIGPKTASRLTFYLLSVPKEEVKALGEAISGLLAKLHHCKNCYNISEEPLCPICSDKSRDHAKICVVEEPLDTVALEKTGYNGIYHVLGGAISPIDGIGPEDLYIKPLLDKVAAAPDNISEVILATNPSLEGEATATYIYERLKPFKIEITRIARGLPVGGDIEYADEITLTRALEGRRSY